MAASVSIRVSSSASTTNELVRRGALSALMSVCDAYLMGLKAGLKNCISTDILKE